MEGAQTWRVEQKTVLRLSPSLSNTQDAVNLMHPGHKTIIQKNER